MGGSIKVINIFKNERFIQTRWTNPLPEYVKNLQFIECDPLYINKYINIKSDFSQEIEHFSANNYGIVIFDFDKKIIYSMQDYCSFKNIEYHQLKYSLRHSDEFSQFFSKIKELWNKNLVLFEIFKNKADDFSDSNFQISSKEELNLQDASFETAYSLLEESYKKISIDDYSGDHIYLNNFVIDWEKAGWKIKEYENDKTSCNTLLNELIQEYDISEDSIKSFKKFIKEKYEE